ncbi:hypothetical protein HGRIS_001496 [Hohenbuehelia grisea]|uniref:Uncharacterized protein n=1 Tax=Hohenbuehelia grisea TaxID=104357 RepID=A0ABR3JRM3_9AGAR
MLIKRICKHTKDNPSIADDPLTQGLVTYRARKVRKTSDEKAAEDAVEASKEPTAPTGADRFFWSNGLKQIPHPSFVR